MIKYIIFGSIFISSFFISNSVLALDRSSCKNYNSSTDRCYYNRALAAKWARDNYDKTGDSEWYTPDNTWVRFPNNCTNFVSQAILAGFVGQANATRKNLWEHRYDYAVDDNSTAIYKWFYKSINNRGEAWSDASDLQMYAKSNIQGYKGIQFQHIESGSPNSLSLQNVRGGDVIFLMNKGDTNNDADHALIVSGINFDFYHTNDPKKYLTVAGNTGDYGDKLWSMIPHSIYKRYEIYRPVYYTTTGE